MRTVTWIIGNGFDINLKLETNYRSFLDKVYLNSDVEDRLRDKLVEVVGEDPRLKKGTHWSDLEGLLAFATKFYETDENLFNETFESMQRKFISYVHEQESVLPEELPVELLREFWASIRSPYDRMVIRDAGRFLLNTDFSEALRYQFISLNYTRVFDRFIEEGTRVAESKAARKARNSVFTDTFLPVFHIHGAVEGGDGRDIVFGVASPRQFASSTLADESSFANLWVKSTKNESIYGNDKTEQMKNIISDSLVIYIFGCSLGESDNYIWKEIGNRLKQEPNCNVVFFAHGLPDRHSQESWLYWQKREESFRKLVTSLGLSAEEADARRDQIFILASADIFRFDALIKTA